MHLVNGSPTKERYPGMRQVNRRMVTKENLGNREGLKQSKAKQSKKKSGKRKQAELKIHIHDMRWPKHVSREEVAKNKS